jgi:hypothetical protein
MKISAKHKKRVNDAIKNLRETLITETIELMKSLGAEPSQPVVFDKTIVMHTETAKGIQTTIFDRVSYNRGIAPFLLVENDGESYQTSTFMSTANLERLYKEVYALAKTH